MSGPDRRAGGVGGAGRPRRVLMTTDAVGGVWQYALDLAIGLRAEGTDVRLAGLGPSPSPAQVEAAARAGLRFAWCNCRLEWMDDPWEDVARAGRWLEQQVDAHAPDLLHLNGYCHAALPWPVPVVVVAHSCVCSWWRAVHGEAAPERFAEYRRQVAAGLRAATEVVAPSRAMRDALGAEYGDFERVRVVRNARRGAGQTDHVDAAGREPLVFSAGRVWDRAKGIDALRAAAAALPWPVVVAGEAGTGEGEPIGPARHLGPLSPDAVAAWMARAAIYALPARYEPFGLSVLEAAGAGCALVLGDIPSLRENWDGAAVFVPPGDPVALASAIRRLIDDPVRRARLAGGARARAARFNPATMVAAYLDVYRHAAASVSHAAQLTRI